MKALALGNEDRGQKNLSAWGPLVLGSLLALLFDVTGCVMVTSSLISKKEAEP